MIDLTTGNFGYGFSDDYKQGYSDGTPLSEELEKIKAEFIEQREYFELKKDNSEYNEGSFDAYNYAIAFINEHIAELKGENLENDNYQTH